eukprot:CAMPEP_0204195612 /NCGR_PEP_ID=MMETSP0361-20130328/63232_1 /ASSEMBLY_ACC=CAM_ASM_000343 /TAXON_ID=268821 /ORGANISM="Scrippsiella Hangoei, Strain SHTV-5" /LENGTH=48 /DNA_ID= /DNA_START= /DNA_END= /DNA_ORIENTATION=
MRSCDCRNCIWAWMSLAETPGAGGPAETDFGVAGRTFAFGAGGTASII